MLLSISKLRKSFRKGGKKMGNIVYQTFFNPGEVVEIRAIGLFGKNPAWAGFCGGAGGGIVSGYFDNGEEFARAAMSLDEAGATGAYFTLNPVNPALLARASNRLVASPKYTSKDNDVQVIRWLPLDLDPVRPSGISSTDEEISAAKDIAREVTVYLEQDLGFAKGLRAHSGNGYHVLYRLPDLPNDDDHRGLIRKAIEAVEFKFRNDKVNIDLKVYNPGRIFKVYGTTARKGDSTKERPHRKSYLFEGLPEKLKEVRKVSLDQLKSLVKQAPPDQAAPRSPYTAKRLGGPQHMKGNLGTLDVGAYLDAYGIEYRIKEEGAVTRYCLKEGLFDQDHRSHQESIAQSPNPPYLTAQCFHDSCNPTWKEARRMISGADSLAPYCANYDPNWTPPTEVGTGILRNMQITPATGVQVKEITVPPPEEIDPDEFFEKRGKRSSFVPKRMVNYITAHFQNIVHTSKIFWHYQNGLWEPISEHSMGQIMVIALKDLVQASWIDNCLKILAHTVNREENEWPIPGFYINCQNGMVNIETGKLEHHDPKYGSRTQIPCRFDWGAKYDLWLEFLDQIFPDEPDKIDLLQQYFGYCLLPDNRFEMSLFMLGVGANGKGTVIHMARKMVGHENTSSLSFKDLGDPRFSLYFLQNKLLNVSTETTTRDPLATEVFKAIVSGEPITAERKYGEKFEFIPYVKFMIAMNGLPIIPDKSYGFERRVLMLKFNQLFKGDNKDPDLKIKLEKEKHGIFVWSLLGLERLLKNNAFVIGDEVTADTKKFVSSLNPLLMFLDERCEEKPGLAIGTTFLYKEYKDWCKEGGHRALSRNRFYEQLLTHVPTVHKGPFGEERRKHFVGIGLKSGYDL